MVGPRATLLSQLCSLHRVHVLHGDFEPRNVVRGRQGLSIIDFSHSSLNHDCPGWRTCEELQKAQSKLGLSEGMVRWLVIGSFLREMLVMRPREKDFQKSRALIAVSIVIILLGYVTVRHYHNPYLITLLPLAG